MSAGQKCLFPVARVMVNAVIGGWEADAVLVDDNGAERDTGTGWNVHLERAVRQSVVQACNAAGVSTPEWIEISVLGGHFFSQVDPVGSPWIETEFQSAQPGDHYANGSTITAVVPNADARRRTRIECGEGFAVTAPPDRRVVLRRGERQ